VAARALDPGRVREEGGFSVTRSTLRRSLAPALAVGALAVPAPASAQLGGLPVDPGGLLPGGLPELPGLPGGGTVPELPSGGTLPGGGTLPELPSGLPTGTSDGSGGGGTGGTGGTSGGGAGGPLDASGPVISGPAKAATVRVDSKGRFRLTGVKVTCPAACSVSVKVGDAGGRRFVRRTYQVAAGGSLTLKKLKVERKAQRALRAMGVARVVASLKASGGGSSASRGIGLKLKPAKRVTLATR
jgi:hypothetical protein